jgi:LAO/AO transport system kinase
MHAFQLMRRKDPDWEPKVKLCSAMEKTGVDKVWEVVEEYRTTMGARGKIVEKRNYQSTKWLWNQLNEQLMKAVSRDRSVRDKAERMQQDLVLGFLSPRSAAAHILDLFLASQNSLAQEKETQ